MAQVLVLGPPHGDTPALDLGSNGLARLLLRDRTQGVSWTLLGSWRRLPAGAIDITLDWEEISWPSEDDQGDGGDVEFLPAPNAAFPLAAPERMRLRQGPGGYEVVTSTLSGRPGTRVLRVIDRHELSLADLAQYYFERSELRELRDKSRLR